MDHSRGQQKRSALQAAREKGLVTSKTTYFTGRLIRFREKAQQQQLISYANRKEDCAFRSSLSIHMERGTTCF